MNRGSYSPVSIQLTDEVLEHLKKRWPRFCMWMMRWWARRLGNSVDANCEPVPLFTEEDHE